MIHASPLIVALMMVIAAMLIGCYLGSKKNLILDVIVGVLGLFLVLCVVIGMHVFS
jgi:hypothetical protein